MYILTVVLLGCVASPSVIGWRLCPSNSTQITHGCGVGHWDIRQLLCFSRRIARCCWYSYLLQSLPATTGPYIITLKPARSEATWRLVILYFFVPAFSATVIKHIYNRFHSTEGRGILVRCNDCCQLLQFKRLNSATWKAGYFYRNRQQTAVYKLYWGLPMFI